MSSLTLYRTLLDSSSRRMYICYFLSMSRVSCLCEPSASRQVWAIWARDTQRGQRVERKLCSSVCVFVCLFFAYKTVRAETQIRPNTRMLRAHTHLARRPAAPREVPKIDKTPQANSRPHRSSATARFISPRVALGRAACLLLATPCRAATRAIARGGRAPRGRRGRRRGAWRARRPSRRAAPWRRRLG